MYRLVLVCWNNKHLRIKVLKMCMEKTRNHQSFLLRTVIVIGN